MANKIFRLTRVEAETLWIAEHKREGETIIPSMMHRVTDNGGEFMVHTGAKLYRKTGGSMPFMVIGYAFDDHDAIDALKNANLHRVLDRVLS